MVARGSDVRHRQRQRVRIRRAHHDAGRTSGALAASGWLHRPGDPHDDGRGRHADTYPGEHDDPDMPRLEVVPQCESVPHRGRPARVREPVDRPPDSVAESSADQAGDQHGDQKVERDRADAQPQHGVGGVDGDHRIDQTDQRVPVEHGDEDVQGGERDRQQRHVAVQTMDYEPRPPERRQPGFVEHPEHEHERQQHQRDRAGRPVQISIDKVGRGRRQRLPRGLADEIRQQPRRDHRHNYDQDAHAPKPAPRRCVSTREHDRDYVTSGPRPSAAPHRRRP